jgi:GAF domain-containing protein
MAQVEFAISKVERQEEDARLEALASTGILDTAPEASFDAITRLAAEYFKADTVLLGFADESRVWIKSHWGEPVRELPRRQSIFERVLAEGGSVVVPDINDDPEFREWRLPLRRIRAGPWRSPSCTCWRASPILRPANWSCAGCARILMDTACATNAAMRS